MNTPALSVEYCTIGDSGYCRGNFYINLNDGDYTLHFSNFDHNDGGQITFPSDITSGSFIDTVVEL